MGSVIGLAHASDDHLGLSYVTPFEVIVGDIESVTDAQVLYPSRE